MAYSKKTWKDRITEYPNRRELTHSDSSTELVTVARSEGTISQEGDAFSAQNMNDLEGRIDSEFSAVDQNLQEINDNLTASNQTAGLINVPFRFGITDDGEYGYIKTEGGADSVIPFRKNANFIQIADSEITSYTITQNDVDNYKQLIIIGQSSTGGGSSISMSATNVDISFTSYNSHSQTTSGVGVFVRNNLVVGDTITVNKGNGMYLKLMVLGVKY